MTNPDDNAFPFKAKDSQMGDWYKHGLTKREYFAAMAMQGMIQHLTADKEIVKNIGKSACELADILINALNR